MAKKLKATTPTGSSGFPPLFISAAVERLYQEGGFPLHHGAIDVGLDDQGLIQLHILHILIELCRPAEEIHGVSTGACPVGQLLQLE